MTDQTASRSILVLCPLSYLMCHPWIRAAAASIGNGSLRHRIFQAPLVLSPTSRRSMLRTELSTSQLCTPSLLLTEQPAALCLTFSLASKRQTVPRSSTPLRFGVPDRQQAARLHNARSKVNCSCGMCFQTPPFPNPRRPWLPASRLHLPTPSPPPLSAVHPVMFILPRRLRSPQARHQGSMRCAEVRST